MRASGVGWLLMALGVAAGELPAQERTGADAWAVEALGGAAGSAAGMGIFFLFVDREGCGDDVRCVFGKLAALMATTTVAAGAGTYLAGRAADTAPSGIGAAAGAVAGLGVGLLALKAAEEVTPRGHEGLSGAITFILTQGMVTALGSRIGVALR